MSEWETVVGLEVHVQLSTTTKLFSSSPVRFGSEPNRDLSPVDVGLPGALPVVNAAAVRCAIRLGLALDATIARASFFSRKHYFYPDLPKGYQITQAERAVVEEGRLPFVVDDASGAVRTLRVVRAHLEEDAGKSVHDDDGTGLDWNRAGTPLLEVVTAPDLSSGDEAMRFFRALRTLVMTLGICDGNLQEGSMRADANVSVRRRGEALGTRVELKNINSPRFLCDAVEHEAARQRALLQRGGTVERETRLWDADAHESRSMRSKEDAPDYRYMPDPDLPPLVIDDDEIVLERTRLPPLPWQRRARYAQLGLPAATIALLVDDEPARATYFERALAHFADAPRALGNQLVNELLALPDGIASLSAEHFADVVRLVEQGAVSGRIGKELLREVVQTQQEPEQLVDARGWRVQRDADAGARLAATVDEVFAAHADQVDKVLAGKDKVKGFLVGMVMKKLGAGADPKDAARAVDEAIERRRA